MSKNLPLFIEYDANEQEQKLVKLFEEQTGRTLYPAQDERLLISIIEYKAALLVNLFNEAARLNLTQYSRGLILDCIGEMFDTPRLQGEIGTDLLKITLNTTFTNDLTLEKGMEVMSKDELCTFETIEDLIIPAGQTTGTVKIRAKEIGKNVNVYGAGDINMIINPVSYIESVTNLNGVKGGADIEDDEAYIKRILLAPERFSCAGSRQSYIYHALSANSAIIDATAESVQTPATVKIGNNTYSEENNSIQTPDFSVTVNRTKGSFTFSLNNVEYVFTMPSDSTVNIYPLVESGETPQSVLNDVEKLLNGEKVNPMTDKVVAISPEKINKSVTLTIKLNENADFESVSQNVNNAIDEYKSEINKTLNAEIIPSQIITKLGAIDGVYSVDTGSLVKTKANINQCFNLSFTTSITQ